jgi:hypothetical protein
LRVHLLCWNDYRAQKTVGGRVLKSGGALLALQQELDAAKPALNLPDARDYAHRVKDVGCRLFGVVALRDRENEAVAFERGFDRSKS